MKLICICEVCGKTEMLMPEEAYQQGWDYPPKMGAFGVVSPRTSGDCGVEGTAWWELTIRGRPFDQLTEGQQETVRRILGEHRR